jgi:hypothetical protein
MTMNKWIGVKVELPPNDNRVLICDKMGWIFTGCYEKETWQVTSGDEWGVRITHWMPLPDLPHDCEKSGHHHSGRITDDMDHWHCDHCEARIERAKKKKSPTER